MVQQINIIPENYKGNPQEALGYAWSLYVPERDSWTEDERKSNPWGGMKADRSKSIPGDDRIGGVEARQSAIAELESQGLVVVGAENISRIIAMAEAGATIEARITCMWCGGASYIAYRMPEEMSVVAVEQTVIINNPGEEMHETAAIVTAQESIALEEMAAEHRHHPGWCNKCHTYCYGDCQAQEG